MSELLIACSDHRIADALARFQERHHFADADRLLVPGGPLVLTRPGMERRVALNCVGLLTEAYAARRVALISHQRCPAYERSLGGLGFDEREILERDLRKVRTLLENEFTGADVSCWVMPWQENGGEPGFGEAQRVE